MLKRLYDGFANVHTKIVRVILENHQIGMDDLPDPEDEMACKQYSAKLCRAMHPLHPFDLGGGDADDSTDADIQAEDSEWDMDLDDIDDGSTAARAREHMNSPDVDLVCLFLCCQACRT